MLAAVLQIRQIGNVCLHSSSGCTSARAADVRGRRGQASHGSRQICPIDSRLGQTIRDEVSRSGRSKKCGRVPVVEPDSALSGSSSEACRALLFMDIM